MVGWPTVSSGKFVSITDGLRESKKVPCNTSFPVLTRIWLWGDISRPLLRTPMGSWLWGPVQTLWPERHLMLCKENPRIAELDVVWVSLCSVPHPGGDGEEAWTRLCPQISLKGQQVQIPTCLCEALSFFPLPGPCSCDSAVYGALPSSHQGARCTWYTCRGVQMEPGGQTWGPWIGSITSYTSSLHLGSPGWGTQLTWCHRHFLSRSFWWLERWLGKGEEAGTEEMGLPLERKNRTHFGSFFHFSGWYGGFPYNWHHTLSIE